MKKIIVVAGATGNLGQRIVKALLADGTEVRCLVRAESNPTHIDYLKNLGATIIVLSEWTEAAISEACHGASCVVSVLAGLRDVVIDAQKVLLNGAIKAGVLRFIPSDYSLDFTRFQAGENRNLDWRREFHAYLDQQPIQATTIFNGAFADMLTDQMPMILFKQKKILYWGDVDRQWDFTTMDNTASFTALAALDDAAPRYLHVAGDRISPRQVTQVMQEITGEKFGRLRPGGKGLLSFIIKVAKILAPAPNELYPAWQGMQYMRNMIDERCRVDQLDNKRYPQMKWTSVKEMVQAFLQAQTK